LTAQAIPARHCERSEAIHSKFWIVSSLALLAMTAGTLAKRPAEMYIHGIVISHSGHRPVIEF
jgi:hypothetical protein